MDKIVLGSLITVGGCAAIIFRKQWARSRVVSQNRTFGLHFGEKQIGVNELVFLLFGLILVVAGILTMLGVVRWK